MSAVFHPLIVLLVSAVLLFNKIPALGQDFASPEDEFGSMLTPLSQVGAQYALAITTGIVGPFHPYHRISCFFSGTPTRPSPWQTTTG